MKFQYLDPVEVINGFYKGLEGYVYKYDERDCTYYVVMTCKKDNTVTKPEDWIDHKHLKEIK